MKNYILLACIILVISNRLTAQNSSWQWVNPLPQGNLLNAVYSVNTDTAIAVGDVGTILRTIDGGSTWDVEQNAAGSDNQLFAVQFVSPSIGWAVGEFGTILKSTNGGETWFQQQIDTYNDLYSVYFISPTVGWVAGSEGTLYQTIDGGNIWTPQNVNTTATFFALTFRTSTVGWVVGTDGIIDQTTDGGVTWNQIASGTTQTLYSIQFTSSTIGYIAGSFGTLLKTINGGSTWISLTSSIDLSLYAMQFTTSQVGWALGSYGTIVKTTNGGTNWFSQTSPTDNDIFGIAFAGSTTGIAVGDYGTIIKTFDGSNWLSISNGPQNTLYGMFFTGPSQGYALGDIGTILRTTDGGGTWATQASGTYQPLYSAYFVSATTGWVVGDSATILKTTNSGTTWSEQNTHTDPSLYSIYFASSTTGWAVGDFGTILATINGGTTWISETSHVTVSLLRIQFATASIGWAVGYNGTIVKTTNGGKNWSVQNSGTLNSLNGLSVVDQNKVFIAGDNGLILATTNGGTIWTSPQTNTYSSLYGISFYSPTLGWAAGDDGTVIGTYDGGVTWQPQNNITAFTFFEVQVVHGTSGGIIYATGEGGTMISSAISPLPMRVWTGAVDSLWFNSGNWSPAGIPEKLDSVYIPATSRNPAIWSAEQQIDIGALTIANNARLTIAPSVAIFTVKNSITLLGTLLVEPTALTQIYTGGSFFTVFTGTFVPGKSTIVFTGTGQMKGTFYSVLLNQTSTMQSIGNITINNNLDAFSNLYLRSSDTLTINNPDPASFDGPGIVSPGTITRAIQGIIYPMYRFESSVTFLEFYPQGTLPSSVSMTVFPSTLPPGLPDSVYARRYYSISAAGGSNYSATMQLRYDTSETSISIDDLALFRDSSGVITNMGSSDFLDSDLVAVSLDSVTGFSQWYLGKAEYYPRHPYEFTDSLFISDHGAKRDTLVFGATSGATDGIDTTLGEAVLPATPSPGTFDVRWILPTSQGSKIDIRDLLNPVTQQRIYNLTVQPGAGGYPMTIIWDSTALANGTFFIRDQSTHGGQFNINMKGQRSFIITGTSTAAIEIVHKIPVFFSFSNGWNLVSLPLNPANDARRITTFPTASSEAFGYSGSYYIADTMQIDHGYWIKFANTQSIGFEGTPRTHDTIHVSDGWNLIGASSTPILKSSISPTGGTSVISNYFQYSNGYLVSDTLNPSRGYWVKVSGAGFLLATPTGSAKSAATVATSQILHHLNSLTITDRQHGKQELYFGDATSTPISVDEFALPPLPPGGVFDARFSSGSMVALLPVHHSSHLIHLQSNYYPVSIQWHIIQHGIESVSLTDPKSGRRMYLSHGLDGSYEITNPSQSVIQVDIEYEPSIPTQFSLEQNYPNPFNPTTQIVFQLPSDSRTTIRVFDLLGQVVATLSDHQLYSAGTHTLNFNGSKLSSGVYFYQMQAQPVAGKEFSQVRKMLMIK
jgi:photosystem II stability/assembly factor-like uncharacterized protein